MNPDSIPTTPNSAPIQASPTLPASVRCAFPLTVNHVSNNKDRTQYAHLQGSWNDDETRIGSLAVYMPENQRDQFEPGDDLVCLIVDRAEWEAEKPQADQRFLVEYLAGAELASKEVNAVGAVERDGFARFYNSQERIVASFALATLICCSRIDA